MRPAQPTSAAERFWRFSTSVYADQAVQGELLALQDEFGADVNVLLFLPWAALEGADPAALLPEALALSRPWARRIAQPLRQARRALKAPPIQTDLRAGRTAYDRLLELEVEIERLHQIALARLLPAWRARPEPCEVRARTRRAYALYAARLPGHPDLGTLLSAVFNVAKKL